MPLRLSPSHESPVPLIKFQIIPTFGLLISSGSQTGMSEFRQSFTLTQKWAELCFSAAHRLHNGLSQPHYVEMYSQGVMSSRKANNHPGFKK
jgi:hypothetical protein